MLDLILLALLIGYAISGYRQGLVVGVLSLGGFLGGAVLAMWVGPTLASGLEPGVQRSIIVLLGVILTAWLGQFIGAMIGSRLRDEVPHGPLAWADQVAGAIAGVVSVALVVWFVAGAVRGGPSPALSRAVAGSRVISTIDRAIPDGAVVLADRFRDIVGGTTFPRVFAGVGPEQISPIGAPDPAVASSAAVTRAAGSIVKITGDALACSRGQEGSGVVVAAHKVMTNAHVVAGVRKPRVQVGGTGTKYSARVVVFDPRRDLAVLDVPDMDARPLTLTENLGRGDSAVVAGFPQNGPFRANAARVRSIVQASGEDIYGKPGALREVYSLFAIVQPGNSGGPVLSATGELVGIVFAKSLDDDNTGYALTADEVRPVLEAGAVASERVSTGGCAVG